MKDILLPPLTLFLTFALPFIAIYYLRKLQRGFKSKQKRQYGRKSKPKSKVRKYVFNKTHIKADLAEEDYDLSGIDFSHPLGQTILPMLLAGDWDAARKFLQKIAYGLPQAKPEEKSNFTNFMKGFASKDPLYQRCMREIKPIIERFPNGIRQTSIYPNMSTAMDVETARYVLYYGDVIGDIVRIKKGNSYMIFPVKISLPSVNSESNS